MRGKWKPPAPNITVGSVVITVDPHLPQSLWQIGKVVKVLLSSDCHIRTAEVQITDRAYTRPIVCLTDLPEIPNDKSSGPSLLMDGCWPFHGPHLTPNVGTTVLERPRPVADHPARMHLELCFLQIFLYNSVSQKFTNYKC